MRTLFDHIENVKGKPHHIRKKVAFGITSAITGLVALLWLGTSLASNAFAIQGSSFAESTGQGDVVDTVTESPAQNLAGVGAAAQDSSVPAHIEIVNIAATTTAKQPVEQTTIPF